MNDVDDAAWDDTCVISTDGINDRYFATRDEDVGG